MLNQQSVDNGSEITAEIRTTPEPRKLSDTPVRDTVYGFLLTMGLFIAEFAFVAPAILWAISGYESELVVKLASVAFFVASPVVVMVSGIVRKRPGFFVGALLWSVGLFELFYSSGFKW